jgi:succinate-semialdehyde dehydrogenase/glutarate-semialdehyde dehydrogenase
MLLASEETFGPVAALFRFRTEEEAIEIANHTPYCLAAYLYTRDVARCFRVPDALKVGMIGASSAVSSREPHSAASRSQAWDLKGRITASRNSSK